MTIELSKEVRHQAISSIERYFMENMEEKIGNIAAGALLGFFLMKSDLLSTTWLLPKFKSEFKQE